MSSKDKKMDDLTAGKTKIYIVVVLKYETVMRMKKYMRWAVPVVLGIVCPMFLLNTGSGGNTDKAPDYTDETVLMQETNESIQPERKRLTIAVLLSDGSVSVQNLDDYLVSVILREMPSEFHEEALKAQAVVARTYALRRKETGIKHPGADICTESNCCQGYWPADDYLREGGDISAVEKIKGAVADTSNLVLTYDGKLIEATYFSCSGGKTEDAVAVWGSDIPYLQSTNSPGEEHAAHFADTVTISGEDFEARLGRDLPGAPSQWLGSVSYTSGGGVDEMDISGMTYSGTTLRKLLGLRSTAFVMTAVGDHITITTKGFGHRVGMSQYGADAMALQGHTFREILSHYYQDTELVLAENLR